jgi:hypothetical protein
MNKLIITVILFVTLVVPALAQDAAKPEATAEVTPEATVEATEVLDGPKPDKDNPFYCEGAQEWYDESMYQLTEVINGLGVISPSSSAYDIRIAFEGMREIYEETEAMEYPECLESPRESLLFAMLFFISAVDEFSKSGDQMDAITPSVRGWRFVGLAQGYSEAIGVDYEYYLNKDR